MSTKNLLVRAAMFLVALFGLGALSLGSFYLGVKRAEEKFTKEVNAVESVVVYLRKYHSDHKVYPPPHIAYYDLPSDKLTVANLSDSRVDYYSGYFGDHLLTLHLRDDGLISTTRQ